MTECPTCKLSMESHQLRIDGMCMKQVGEEFVEEQKGYMSQL